jgi:hypothetical protein
MSERAAKLMGLTIACEAGSCFAHAPREVLIGDMKISLAAVEEAKIPQSPDTDGSLMDPGMSAEIKIPSTILRKYDVLINFPDRELSLGQPGTMKFKGVTSNMLVDPDTGLIQIPGKLENKNCMLLLDVGTPVSFLSGELFSGLATAHPDWPHMTGAVGPANMWGGTDETKWQLMRIERLQFGPLYLTDVPVIAWPEPWKRLFELHEKLSPAGMIGSGALINYRIGLDYKHSTAYFDLGSTFKFPDYDVVGLIVRPDPDSHYMIVGVADLNGEPSVPSGGEGVEPGDQLVAVDGIPVADSTMGQVWSLLEGSPGQQRQLKLQRDGKQITVMAKVQHFLAEPEENHSKQPAAKKK